MNLLKNPFHILGVTPLENRRKITQVAEEKSLFLDIDICNEAKTTLTSPTKRLFTELAWLSHSDLDYVKKFLPLLEENPIKLIELIFEDYELHELSKINLFSSAILLTSNYNKYEFIEWIMDVAEYFDIINIEDIFEEINLSREVSGFPKIIDKNLIRDELINLEQYYCQSMKNALDKFDSRELVQIMIEIVEQITDDGNEECPQLVAKLIDLYEIEVQDFFVKEEKNIDEVVMEFKKQLKNNENDIELDKTVNTLIALVKNWDFVAQPIQVKCKSQGVKHNTSVSMAHKLRNLSIETYNEYKKIDLVNKLNKMLQEVFAELPDIIERLDDDEIQLNQISNERVALIEQSKLELTYQVEIGMIFKEKFIITPDSVSWQGKHFALDSVQALRWGAISSSVNGIPTGTTYHITIDNGSYVMKIQTKKQNNFANIVDRLWKGIGVRLLLEHIDHLKKGNYFKLNSALMYDEGIEFTKIHFLKSDEKLFYKWSNIGTLKKNGSLFIFVKNDHSLTIELSYINTNNTFIYETAINMLKAKCVQKISDTI